MRLEPGRPRRASKRLCSGDPPMQDMAVFVDTSVVIGGRRRSLPRPAQTPCWLGRADRRQERTRIRDASGGKAPRVNPNPLDPVANICRRHGKGLLIDAVASFGAMPIEARSLAFDAVTLPSE
jgi:hypothetical protein